MQPARLLLALAAVALVVSACGSDDTTDGASLVDDETTTTSTTAAVVDETTTTTTGAPTGEEGRVAADGDTVEVHYTGTLDDGEQFDSSVGKNPLSFVVGSGQVIPGFDDAVRGLAVGEKVTVRIPADQAYGERSDEFIVEFPIDQAPEGLQVGDPVQLNNGSIATVIEVTDTTITIDANHQLAGEALTFEIELVSIS